MHAVLTGPIKGGVTLADGTEVDVTPSLVLVETQEQADEVSFLIGERYAEEGHPDDIERESDGSLVQRPFERKVPTKFSKHPGRYKGKPAGTPRRKG